MIPTPSSLGLPSKFKNWRPNQWQAIEEGLECAKRVAVQVQRGGRGKTVTFMTQALLPKNWRVVILTANKGLQDQALEDWAALGLVDIRGKSSYDCEGGLGTCEDGSLSKCMFARTGMCTHNAAIHAAKDARMLISNYSCWTMANKYGQGFGTFDMMICDEAHNIPAEVSKAMRIQIGNRELEQLSQDWPDDRKDMAKWKRWSQVLLILAEKKLEDLTNQMQRPGRPAPGLVARFKQLRNLTRKLAELATCRADRWIAGEWQYGYEFNLIEAGAATEKVLFCGIPKIILTSGTIRPKTMEMCGLTTADYEFFDYPCEINPERSPLMQVQTGIKVNKSTPDYQKRQLVQWIDKIIDGRLDRKGIIHTANFKLRDFIKAHSKHRKIMDTNYAGQDRTVDVINRFKEAPAPRALISPSVTTGYDFPFDYCRYQIIVKLPYEDISTDIVQARLELDPKYTSYNMMQNLAQAFSRGDRGDDDQQEVFCLDENIGSAMWHNSDLAPSWLPAYFCVVDNIPEAPALGDVPFAAGVPQGLRTL